MSRTQGLLPSGWHRLFGGLVIAFRNRSESGVYEYHAKLYRQTTTENGDVTDIKDLVEVFFYTATHLGLSLTLDGMEHRWEVHIGLPKLTIGLRGGKPRYPSREREYGWSYHDGTLWLYGGRSPDEWSRDQPWWWEQTVNFRRLIFGKTRYDSREIGKYRGIVSMPEGDYPCAVTLSESSWHSDRPLLGRFVSKSLTRAEVEPDRPIPHPGKGESSYDLDEDALYSLSTPCDTIREALESTRDTVMRQRERYGGPDWRPEKGVTA